MKYLKRIALFLVVNLLVVMTVSLLLTLFNVQPYLTQHGLDLRSLLIFCLIWGMGGAFISLQLSRKMATWMLGVRLVNPEEHKTLVTLVASLAKQAGLPAVPQVGIFRSNDINAFATGPSARRSLVAVSTGLLNRLQPHEIEAVLAHEISHIANGDMVTMTLMQGVMNAFVMFLARALAFAISSMGRGNNKRTSPLAYYGLVMLFEMVFMIFGSMAIAAFSRWREYQADRGGASLAGKENMIAALSKLQAEQMSKKNRVLSPYMIHGPRRLSLFSTHPPLAARIEKLRCSS